jgi:HSP20 family protein
MKKIAIALVLSVLVSGIAFAQVNDDEDQTAIDMKKIREKIVRTKTEFDKLMKDVLSTYPEGYAGSYGQDVKIDVMDSGKNMIVRADLPGMEKDKIDITLDKNKFLKISGSREIVKSQTAPGIVRQERSVGRFERMVELPFEGTSLGIMASYKDGVLEIVIPKKESTKEETIKVQVM